MSYTTPRYASIRLDPLQAEQEAIPRIVYGPLLLPNAL
ncbi:MAG: hypothetical protein QOD29_3311 [Alphaproteobacteria bacterium]|jgi:hypothetical protein|nr:hypothetical protein [Alphaproteobacteria bacterium]